MLSRLPQTSTETQIQPSTPRRVKFPQPEFSRSFKSSPAASTAHHGGRGSRKRSKKRLSGADFLDLEAVVNSDEEEEEDEGEDGTLWLVLLLISFDLELCIC
ncbi:hypothetical protein RchiOBHm_Chr5g0080211 [Rosa chinensis]|uniref:Uncharacterized protein n=1 Tax=Rosa chinensis TaxID=74649 RepID=A0A2P6QMP7_ROSCH|nr:hypothetical protein RchiOBHm_Chr5g0080211 [Rosa chinensis]